MLNSCEISPPHASPQALHLGYCTNVHAGRDLQGVFTNLAQFCSPIRQQVAPDGKLGVGLWFSEVSAREAIQGDGLDQLRHQLERYGLVAFTLNGFPQIDFHTQVVKHRVYAPTWWEEVRRDYTLNLIRILDSILPEGELGSISTMPIAWGTPVPTNDQLEQASRHLMDIAQHLHQLEERTGRRIVLAIEPEPGCYMTDSASFRSYYDRYLSTPHLSVRDAEIARRYLGICHDVCHAAVMFEDQAYELRKLRESGILVGKVQVSSAIEITWDNIPSSQREEAMQQLRSFSEDRYLHQTHCRHSPEQPATMYEDLPQALAEHSDPNSIEGTWRIHFHVPIFCQTMGHLQSTQSEIHRMLDCFQGSPSSVADFTGHFEVETYAWSVLPKNIATDHLPTGIAQELKWFQQQIARADV